MDTVNLNNRNRYVVLTGATSGIGYELAKLFAENGYNLVLVARSEERLQKVTDRLKQAYSVEVTPMVKDLFTPSSAEELYNDVKKMGITVDALVNDAGQGEWGPFADTPLERHLAIIQLNIASLVSLTKLFLADMLPRNEGKILQLGSEAGTAPAPLLAVYAATKAFVISFSAALSNELKDTGITVTVLLPGATDTDFFHKAHQEGTVGYKEVELLDPAEVARDGFDALMKGESKIISGAKTKRHVFMNDLLGTEKSASLMRKQMEPSTEPGDKQSSHGPSREEREHIREKTGQPAGDLTKEKQSII